MIRPLRRRARLAAVAALVSGAVLIPVSASAASAGVAAPVSLNGDWAPFNRCPVNNPAMLQADGVNQVPFCVASSSPTATLTIGNMTPTTSSSDLQFGLLSTSTGFTVSAPATGSVLSPAVSQPGGLRGLLCPATTQPLKALCKVLATHPKQNKVSASLMSAGAPSNFNLVAGLSAGIPIVSLPVKIHLKNPHLGPNCFIGTNANPIVLDPENATQPSVSVETFDGNGTPDPAGPMDAIFSTGGTQQDLSFTVPEATGCGDGGMFDAAINHNAGLPSPAGASSLVLTNASAFLGGLANPAAVAPNAGATLSQFWHSAITNS